MDVEDPCRKKAITSDYAPDAFWFRQDFEPERDRIAAWTNSLTQLQSIFWRLLAEFSADVYLQFKAEHEWDYGWDRFEGTVSLEALTRTLHSHREFFFEDGAIMFVVRHEDTGEMLVLDAHGILFVYSDDSRFERLITEEGFACREEKLLYEQDHGHCRTPGHEVGGQEHCRHPRPGALRVRCTESGQLTAETRT